MTRRHGDGLLGRLWVRTAAAASAVMILTLVVVVFAVYELTLASERNDLDEVLDREGTVIASEVVAMMSADPDPPEAEGARLQEIVARVLSAHPGSALHLASVRWEDEVLSSARGPERLLDLRDAGMLPRPPEGLIVSRKGIRSRSQVVDLPDVSLIVETLGDDQAIADDARDVAQRTLLASSIGGLVGLVALAVTVRRSTRHISRVSAAVRRTQLDDLSHRIPDVAGSHEVAVLARDVNRMLDDIALARAARNELVATVSHEIRTPLAAARGHMDLLREGRASDPTVALFRIDRELARMTRLVDDLLALSRASDPAWLVRRLVNTREIMDSVMERAVAVGAPGIAIGSVPDVVVEVDADRVLQAMSNLILNAILHTPEGTAVAVDMRVSGNRLELIVSDDGPGIPVAVLDGFGAAFVRGSESGTGLGLAVARAVATAHGGALEVTSGTGGTTVVLSVPIEPGNQVIVGV